MNVTLIQTTFLTQAQVLYRSKQAKAKAGEKTDKKGGKGPGQTVR